MKSQSAKEQLINYDVEYSLKRSVICTDEENQKYLEYIEKNIDLPDNVWECMENEKFNKKFAKMISSGLTDAEENRLLMYNKIKILSDIRSCCIFFVVITCIGAAVGLLLAIL